MTFVWGYLPHKIGKVTSIYLYSHLISELLVHVHMISENLGTCVLSLKIIITSHVYNKWQIHM